jgi:hypothetical protein
VISIAAMPALTSISPRITFGRSLSCSVSGMNAACSIRQAKSWAAMSSWRWPSPIGIDFAAASVHGPAGVAV